MLGRVLRNEVKRSRNAPLWGVISCVLLFVVDVFYRTKLVSAAWSPCYRHPTLQEASGSSSSRKLRAGRDPERSTRSGSRQSPPGMLLFFCGIPPLPLFGRKAIYTHIMLFLSLLPFSRPLRSVKQRATVLRTRSAPLPYRVVRWSCVCTTAQLVHQILVYIIYVNKQR